MCYKGTKLTNTSTIPFPTYSTLPPIVTRNNTRLNNTRPNNTRIKQFVYVKHDTLVKLFTDNTTDNFTKNFSKLLQALNNIPDFKNEMYTQIFSDPLKIEDCITRAIAIAKKLQNPTAQSGASKPKKYKKSPDKFKYNNHNYVVYMGTRSGLYIKLNGGYKSVKTITRNSAFERNI